MSQADIQSKNLVGIDVLKRTIRAVCLSPDGAMVDSFEAPIDGQSGIFEQLVRFISAARDRFGLFEKVGVAVPGLVDRKTRRVAFSTINPEHEKVDFSSELEKKTGVRVAVENDANAAAYGEFILGAGRGSQTMFYATLGTGVGGALIYDGRIWHGTSGFAGEFGHIAINSDGLKLEGVASSANIVQRTKKRFHQDHTSSLNKIGETDITLADIIKAAREEDDFSRMMLERTGGYIGTAIAGVINLLNIEKIVVGGEIMQARSLVLDAIIERARKLTFAPSFDVAEIVEGELGVDATAIGVALLSAE